MHQAQAQRPNQQRNPSVMNKVIRMYEGNIDKLGNSSLGIGSNDPTVSHFRGANLCWEYYLLGCCGGYLPGLQQDHSPDPLSDHQFECLRFLARGQPCYQLLVGRDCQEERCFYRHDQYLSAPQCRCGKTPGAEIVQSVRGTSRKMFITQGTCVDEVVVATIKGKTFCTWPVC